MESITDPSELILSLSGKVDQLADLLQARDGKMGALTLIIEALLPAATPLARASAGEAIKTALLNLPQDRPAAETSAFVETAHELLSRLGPALTAPERGQLAH